MTVGLSLRSLLDAEIRQLRRANEVEYSNKEIQDIITKLEDRIKEWPWLELSDGTTYEKTFIPGPHKAKQPLNFIEALRREIMNRSLDLDVRDVESHLWYNRFLKLIEDVEQNYHKTGRPGIPSGTGTGQPDSVPEKNGGDRP